jgi:ankyrin repeat protein
MKRSASRYIPLGVLLALACLTVVLVVMANRQAHLNAALVQAVNTQFALRVGVLLAEGADANTRDETGHPPSPWYWSILHTLRIRKMPVPPPYYGPTVLMIACDNGDINTTTYLLAHGARANDFGADPDDPDRSGKVCPLYETVDGRSVQYGTSRYAAILRMLLHYGASVNSAADWSPGESDSVLEIASESDETSLALILLNHGADPNADNQGESALSEAVSNGNVPLVKALLLHGAKANARGTGGKPLLFDADVQFDYDHDAKWKHKVAVITEMLLANGADANAPYPYEGLPLLEAEQNDNNAQANILIQAGANVDIKVRAPGGYTALTYAEAHPAGKAALIKLMKAAHFKHMRHGV